MQRYAKISITDYLKLLAGRHVYHWKNTALIVESHINTMRHAVSIFRIVTTACAGAYKKTLYFSLNFCSGRDMIIVDPFPITHHQLFCGHKYQTNHVLHFPVHGFLYSE